MTWQAVTAAGYPWEFLGGVVLGGFAGVLAGEWAAWLFLVPLRRDPLRWLGREYGELWRDIVHLCVTGHLRPGR